MTLMVVEFRSTKDKSKLLAKEYDGPLTTLIQAPSWCDEFRVGKGRFYVPKNAESRVGVFEITKLTKRYLICEAENVTNLDEFTEIIPPLEVAKRKERAKIADELFYSEYKLAKDEYIQELN